MQVFTVALIIIACVIALFGLFNLTQATQGVGILALACFIAIMARLTQAHEHFLTTRPQVPVAPRGLRIEDPGFIRPPDSGTWPPSVGDRFALGRDLRLRVEPHRDAAKLGAIPHGTRLVVVTVQGNWLFLQTEDGLIEGWAGTSPPKAA